MEQFTHIFSFESHDWHWGNAKWKIDEIIIFRKMVESFTIHDIDSLFQKHGSFSSLIKLSI